MDASRQSNVKRRPLPTPNTSPTRESPAPPARAVTPISPAQFYGTANLEPPPLPRRNQGVGSSHTGYHYIPPYEPPTTAVAAAAVAEPSSPPSYASASFTPTLSGAQWRSPELVQEVRDDDIPELVSTDVGPEWNSRGRSPTFHELNSWAPGVSEDWVANASISPQSHVGIDGRNLAEEEAWWDLETRVRTARPGPGVLPTLLAEKLHDADHSLFTVIVTPPEISPSSSSPSSYSPPTPEQVREAVPHPNALYCRKDNSWILLVRRAAGTLPPLAPSFQRTHRGVIFPSTDRRKMTESCVDEHDQPFGQMNLTHHFHVYPRAVAAGALNPPFELFQEEDGMEGIEEMHGDQGVLLDLYVCCQCSVYVVCSGLLPGVIPVEYLDELVRERAENPSPGQTPNDSAIIALDTTMKILENLLWRNETRALPLVPGKSFMTKVGVSAAALNIYQSLDFTVSEPSAELKDALLIPPSLNTESTRGLRQYNRPRLLRAWVELGAWLQDYRKRFPPSKNVSQPKPWIAIENARERYQRDIGAHPDQIEREPLPGYPRESHPLDAVERLGFTPTAYSQALLEFAYRAQCRCDPTRTPQYYEALWELGLTIRAAAITFPAALDTLLSHENARGRWMPAEFPAAARALGFGRDNVLKVTLEEAEDAFVLSAWADLMARAWREVGGGVAQRRDLVRALRIVAEGRASRRLREEAHASRPDLTPEKAYQTLEVPKDVDEEMLIAVYRMRIEDQPTQSERMKEALGVIAQWTESARLRTFLETGDDPGESVQAFHPDWPRGLNQLGNTCYLNSLLQYFYTIKELRDALTPLSLVDDVKLSDDDLKRHRVGGRLVTRKEIMRSRKFVAALGNLFWQLEYSDVPAVTPDVELAKLALVTSKDEEEDEHGRNDVGTDSSASTDATLVDEPTPLSTSPSPSVLGKRARPACAMDVDTGTDLDRDGFVMVRGPAEGEKDVEMQDAEKENKAPPPPPPPLPPRRKTDVGSESVMMFGKQHDVAECMDNCMFQIETALLRFDEIAGSDKSKISVVKRLFYGTIRQRISPFQSDGRGSSVHEKEDAFSHLPVNVSEESFDIYDGLSGYFDDVVEFEGKKAKMEVSLVDLPPLLQIQLQRVQFNRDTLQPYKSHAYVRFGEVLYMDRFLDGADPAKKTQSKSIQAELNACRDRIHALTQSKGAPFADGLARTVDFLSNQDAEALSGVDEDLITHLDSEQQAVRTEIAELRTRAATLKEQLEAIWRDERQVEYELTSVFVHRGSSASWGHYFFYSRYLPDKPDVWFKYNDSEVTQVRRDEVLADTTGSTANPYLLVYARKGADMVHTVKRADMTTST